MITVEKWEDYQIEELKNQQQTNNKATTNQHKQECKEIYLYLFNKYKEQILDTNNFGRKINIIGDLKQEQEYELLSIEEQNTLFNELMNLKRI